MKPPLKPPIWSRPWSRAMKPPLTPLTDGCWVTLAHCDLMETRVQASSGWMLRRRVLTHCGPEAAPEAARWRWSLPWLGSVQTLAVPADSGRTVEIFLQGHIVNLGGKRERERDGDPEAERFLWRHGPKWGESAVHVEYVCASREIQNPGLGEHRLRDLDDEINKLIREKGHWEVRILELGAFFLSCFFFSLLSFFSWEGALGSEDLGAWRPGLCHSWPSSYRQWRKGVKPQIPGVSLLAQ